MKKDFDKFDNSIKEALEHLEASFNPDDWAAMEQQLDAEKAIDTEAKDALNDFEVGFNPAHWAMLASQLDEVQFDAPIKETLDEVDVPFDANNWAAMEQQLDKMQVDQPVKQALANYETPFDPDNWARMEEELERKKHVYLFMWLVKSVEVAVVSMLLFLMFNTFSSEQNDGFQPNNELNKNGKVAFNQANKSTNDQANATNQTLSSLSANEQQTTEEQSDATHLAKAENKHNGQASWTNSGRFQGRQNSVNHENSNTNKSANNVNDIATNNNKTNALASTSVKQSNNKSVNSALANANKEAKKSNSAKAKNQQEAQTSSNIDNVQSINVNTLDEQVKNSANTLDQSDNDKEVASTLGESQNEVENTTKEHQQKSTKMLAAVDVRKTKLVKDPIFELKKLDIPEPYIRQLRVGMLFSPNLEMNNNYGRGGIGYTFGLTLETDLFKKMSVRTGLNYAQRRFSIEEQRIVDNTDLDGARHQVNAQVRTNLFVLQIPVYAQYIVHQDEKWRVYLTAGAGANFIVGRQYTGQERTSFNGVIMNAEVNDQNYMQGMLEGGSFKENVYMTMGMGFGVERQLGDRLSLYLMPQYEHTLTPIGQEGTLINSFSLNVGLKTVIR